MLVGTATTIGATARGTHLEWRYAMGEQHNEEKTGAGSEAAEGVHGANKHAQHSDDESQPGSEPLEHRDAEHKSGYGGEKAAPKTSSDQR